MAGEGNGKGLGIAVIVALFLTAGIYAVFGVAKGPVAEVQDDPRQRELVEADFASASPCARSKLAEFLQAESPKVLRVYNLEVAQFLCDQDAKTEDENATMARQRAALDATLTIEE